VTSDAAPHGRVARVLICDDDDPVRRLVTVIVDRTPGFQVVGEARDGNEAVRQAESLQPDAIVLDLGMPVRSGLEALPDLRRVAPDAVVVVLSGFSREIFADEALRLGAAAYLEKGVAPDEIVDAIGLALSEPR
jgi:DNA-binding NarL/FixJ family response regulator